MSWFRRKKIDLPSEDRVGTQRSQDAVRESKEKLEEAKKQRAEVVKIAKKSKELDRRSDFFAEALERAMRRGNG